MLAANRMKEEIEAMDKQIQEKKRRAEKKKAEQAQENLHAVPPSTPAQVIVALPFHS